MGTSAVTHCAVENRLEHFSMALLHCPYKVDNFRLLTFKVSQFDLSGLRYEAETVKNRTVGSHFCPLHCGKPGCHTCMFSYEPFTAILEVPEVSPEVV